MLSWWAVPHSPDLPTQVPFQPFLASRSSAFLAKISQSTNNLLVVTLQTEPAGLTLFVDGTLKFSPDLEYWAPGSIHFLAAPPVSGDVLGQGTNTQYVWTSWSDGQPFAHQVLAAPDASFTASFKTNFFLTMGVTNTTAGVAAGGAVSPGSGWFDAGAVVAINAIAPIGDSFTGWLGAGLGSTSSNDNMASITMGGPITETASFTGPLTNVLTVVTNGHGYFSPALNGKVLQVGRYYTIVATPGLTNLFTGWSGGVSSANAALRFQMEDGLVLQANFIPSPFVSSAGSYAGLFADTNGVRFQNSGFFTAAVAARGGFSARLLLAGISYPISGRFALDGSYTTTFLREGLLPFMFLSNSI